MKKSDVIVLGVGGMGSSACYHLARRGLRVTGIEQFQLGHSMGSSHGQTRIIRKAYFESPEYVPLLNRSYELWRELEERTGRQLYHETGLLYLAPEDSKLYRGIVESSRLHQIPLQNLKAADAAERFPMFRIPAGLSALFEPGAGYLEVENSVFSHAQAAAALGAELRTGETVRSWSSTGSSVEVITDRDTYQAERLVVCAGPWSSRILEELRLPLRVLRKVLIWYPAGEKYSARSGMPCFLFLMPYGNFYGFPWIEGQGLKVAEHSGGQETRGPDALDREVSDADRAGTGHFMRDVFPEIAAHKPSAGSVCMYTVTPDENFIVDRHPERTNVTYAAGFSGHGFKFASVIGEVLADLAIDGKTSQPVEFLRARRFFT